MVFLSEVQTTISNMFDEPFLCYCHVERRCQVIRILRVEVLPTNGKSEDVVWPGVEFFRESTIYTCEGGGYFSFKVGTYLAHIHVNNLQYSNLNLKDFISIKIVKCKNFSRNDTTTIQYAILTQT